MLPGFNTEKDEQFMAIEGFTSGLHNRSDEAFTIADLEKFKVENFDNTIPQEDGDEPTTTTGVTTTTKPSKGKAFKGEATRYTTTTKYKTTKPSITTKTTVYTDTTTTKPTVYTGPTTTTTTTKFDKYQARNNPYDNTPATTKPATTKPATTKPATNSPFRNLEPYEDDMHETDTAATEEEDDPENPIDDRGMSDETPTEEEDAPVVEGELNEDEELSADKDMEVTEGFTGSILAHESWLNTFLKALLLTFIVFVLMHPSTSKILTNLTGKLGGKLGVYKELILSGLFFVLAYIIIIAF